MIAAEGSMGIVPALLIAGAVWLLYRFNMWRHRPRRRPNPVRIFTRAEVDALMAQDESHSRTRTREN